MLEVKFTIGERSFSKTGYPTVGELIDIQTTKNTLSKGSLGDFYGSNLLVATSTAKVIEAISFFVVLFPDVVKALKSESILSLELPDAAELISIYSKQGVDYMEAVYKMLNGVVKEG